MLSTDANMNCYMAEKVIFHINMERVVEFNS